MNEEWGLLFSECGDGNVAEGEILSFSRKGVNLITLFLKSRAGFYAFCPYLNAAIGL